ncbi:hypothetical protein JCM8547_005310 [Rhodosporidiobolus lusitaniae]
MASIAESIGAADAPLEVLYLVALHFIDQASALLKTVNEEQLTATSRLSPGSSIGKHLRHIVDHYTPLLDALEASSLPSSPSTSPTSHPTLRVNYDRRTRNGAAETSLTAARAQFETLRMRLARCTGEGKGVDPERAVRLEAVTPVKVEVGTTVARELWFSSFHAVHHFALIRVIACGELDLTVPDDFGVAPATLKHRESEAAPTSPKL